MIEPDTKYNREEKERDLSPRTKKKITKVIKGVNDLATTNPELVPEWDYAANDGLTPEAVSGCSGRKVHWLCKRGHSWAARVVDRTKGRGCPYCTNKLPIKGETDLESLFPHIAKQWDYSKNGELRPDEVAVQSNKKVFWLCEKGHSWQARIQDRTRGRNCPYCAKKLPIKGETDLETLFPQIAKQWDYSQNGKLKPDEVTSRSHKKVFWVCEKGHSWSAEIYSRTSGNDCPYCAGRIPIKGETDLETLFPQIAKQWDYSKNGQLKPDEVTSQSHKKVFWVCEKGHSWSAAVYHRTNDSDCPYCTGKHPIKGETDLETLSPQIAMQWDYTKNGQLKPNEVTAQSGRKVFWLCEKGHSWRAKIYNRTHGKECPYCAGRYPIKGETDIETLFPQIAKQWDWSKNGKLKPDEVTPQSHKKVFWTCIRGHSWSASIYNRTRGSDCPYCTGRRRYKTIEMSNKNG